MSFSLNETEATGKKAARGVGYSWGMAEEAGKAVRWLSAHGLDGPKALALVLENADGSDLATMTPTSLQGDWRAEGGVLCPLIAGAALADSASLWGKNGLLLNNVNVPVTVLPFAAQAARRLGVAVTVGWEGASAVIDGAGLSLTSSNAESLLTLAANIQIKIGGQLGPRLPTQHRATLAPGDWRILTRFAARTYAPATEESRLKGAGAGLSDND